MHFFACMIRSAKNVRNWWIDVFWEHPNRLWALKVTVTIAILLIPCVIAREYFVGATLSLGVVGIALAETDVHPRSRIFSLSVTLIGVLLASAVTELLKFEPVWLGVWLTTMSFALTIVGGISGRMQGITFGIILVTIYTTLGMYLGKPWYYQPILLPLGGLFYGIISLAVLYTKPFRMLEEQLATTFARLGDYFDAKASFFPSKSEQQETYRNLLAIRNIAVVDQIELYKNDLNRFKAGSGTEFSTKIDAFYRLWMILQEIHERAASSHEQYDLLSEKTSNSDIMVGFGQILSNMGNAMRAYSHSILNKTKYTHPVSLKWAITAQQKMVNTQQGNELHTSLSLLMKNLTELEKLLQNIPLIQAGEIPYEINYKGRPVKESLRYILHPAHPRFRFAMRMAFSFLAGYLALHFFKIDNGYWIILTSFLVCQQTYSATRQRLYHRILGTMAGVILGILLAQILPTKAGEVILLLGSIYAFFVWVKTKYTRAVVFITIFVLASFNIQFNQGVPVMLPRLIDTFIGALIVFISVRFFWPDWQYKQLPALLLTAIEKNKNYFDSVYNLEVDKETYNHIRRRAHYADSALTRAWRSMQLEPKSKRAFQQTAFNLTYLNHSLISYISAFGIHDFKTKLTPELKKIYEMISSSLTKTLDVLSGKIEPDKVSINFAELEAEIEKLRHKENPQEIVLFINVARVANELFFEAGNLAGNNSERS